MASACTNGLDTGFIELGYAKVAALGVVQGISELMPISSTAHMRIVPALFGWQDPGSAFSAAMQLAALAAVISYFWKDVRGLVFGSIGAVARRDFSDWNFRFAVWIVLATLPIVIAALPLFATWIVRWLDEPATTLPKSTIGGIVQSNPFETPFGGPYRHRHARTSSSVSASRMLYSE